MFFPNHEISFKKWRLFSGEEIIFQATVVIFCKCLYGLLSHHCFHHISRDIYAVETIFDKLVKEILKKSWQAGAGG